ncbi:fatty acid synthase-like [Vespula squamosa]
MVTSGKIGTDVFQQDRRKLDNLIGMEYSGISISGHRVMGLKHNRGCSNSTMYIYHSAIALYINAEIKKGIKDLKTINQETSLAELGMDSMMGVEIKQTLEREFEIYLNAEEIRWLNFAKLVEMDNKRSDNDNRNEIVKRETLPDRKIFMQLLGEGLSCEIFVSLETNLEEGRSEIFFIPEKLKDRTDFTFVGYSFGSLLSIELTRELEARGFNGRLILIDGAPQLIKELINQQVQSSSEEELQNNVLISIMDTFTDSEQFALKLEKFKTWNEKLNAFFNVLSPEYKQLYFGQNQRNAIFSYYIYYKISIIKYCYFQITADKVEVQITNGNHIMMLEDIKIAMAINGELPKKN